MGELEGCDPVYQPTNFWTPGVHDGGHEKLPIGGR
jgi:hypothetical protein